MIRFLHLSDLHLTRDSYESDWEAGGILKKLIYFVSKQPPFDFVFVTGDLAKTGGDPERKKFHSSEYGACKDFLDKLAKEARLPESKRLWLIPGNHDVYEPNGRSLYRLESVEEIDSFFTFDASRKPYLIKFEPFIYFMKNFQPKCILAESDTVREPEVINVRGTKIGILPLNSAWFSMPDGNDHGRLAVGHRLLVNRANKLKTQSPDFVIALIHHPDSYLNDAEKSFRDALVSNCDIILRGHLHSLETKATSIGNNQIIDITAGATYDTEKPKGRKRIFIGELDPAIKQLRLRAYMPSEEGSTWVDDNDAFAGKACREIIFGKTIIIQDCIDRKCPPITYTDPTSIRKNTWIKDISDWFIGNKINQIKGAYYICPQEAIKQLVHHLVDILRYMEKFSPQASHGNKIQYLAAEILLRIAGKETWAANSSDERELIKLIESIDNDEVDKSIKYEFTHRANEGWIDQHRVILHLFTKGLHNQLSHLFQVPSVNTKDLLSINGYAQLLLATRLHGEGRFEESNALIMASPAKTCCIGRYVRGQNLRQLGNIDLALSAYKTLINEKPNGHNFRSCPITSTGSCMCNSALFECELNRAVGVVYRKLKDFNKAETFFKQAIESISNVDIFKKPSCKTNRDSLCGSYEKQIQRVAADFHFGYGYFIYENSGFIKDRSSKLNEAAQQFEKAIKLLEGTDTNWDSPSTRLGIIRLIQNNVEEAKHHLNDAYERCEASDVRSNRSAPLSRALCVLGLAVIDIEKDGATNLEPMSELEKAIDIAPSLKRGPIECHIADAQNILLACTIDGSKALVNCFIERLNSELNC